MRTIASMVVLFILMSGCSSKRAQRNLSSGNYDDAIQTAVSNLRNNKEKKRKQEYIYILEEAFAKAKDRDQRDIKLWAADANPVNLEKIYNTYLQMNNRQEIIMPLLPLKLLAENRNANFPFEDYSDQIISSKNALSKYLYDSSVEALKTADKLQARQIFDDLKYLQSINPNFKNTKKLIEEAQLKGTDFVSVYTKNETNLIIPARLQNDLLDFSTLGLNDSWTVYHSNRNKGITYDYGIVINFREIIFSPEQVKETEFTREREIIDGKKKLLNANGAVVKDSLGQAIVVDNVKIVKVQINEFRQFKSCSVVAKVDYIDFNTNQLLNTFPMASEFVFENIFARYNGDERAIEDNYAYLKNRSLPFPSNEQMVYDTGEDLKAKLKGIISRNRIRRN